MCNQSIISRSLQAAFLFLLSFVGSFALAQAPVPEQALTQTLDDPQLKWGPCPPFLPKGCAIAVLTSKLLINNRLVVMNSNGSRVN